MQATKIGFTGTKHGMVSSQKDAVERHLRKLKKEGYLEFHHGDCIGSDAQAAKIAKELGFRLVCHPGHPKDKNNTMFRAFTDFNDEVREPLPFITRDHNIVDETHCMVAVPAGNEVIRSGTWTTVRYAKKQMKPITIMFPPQKLDTYLTGQGR